MIQAENLRAVHDGVRGYLYQSVREVVTRPIRRKPELISPTRSGLENRVKAVVDSIETSRFPLVIELSGMPKVGKTVFAGSLVALFRRCGCRVATPPEASIDCPIADKWSTDFSAWKIAAFIKRLLEYKESGQQIVVVDRGLFDAIVWLRVKRELGKCDRNTFSNLRRVAQTKLWWSHQCLVLVFCAEADEVLRRAKERRLYEGESLVTTASNLHRLQLALEEETELCNRERALVKQLDLRGKTMIDVLHTAAETVVSSLEEYLQEPPTWLEDQA